MLFTTSRQIGTLHIRNESEGECRHGNYHGIMAYLGSYQAVVFKPTVISGPGTANGGRNSWFLQQLAIQK